MSLRDTRHPRHCCRGHFGRWTSVCPSGLDQLWSDYWSSQPNPLFPSKMIRRPSWSNFECTISICNFNCTINVILSTTSQEQEKTGILWTYSTVKKRPRPEHYYEWVRDWAVAVFLIGFDPIWVWPFVRVFGVRRRCSRWAFLYLYFACQASKYVWQIRSPSHLPGQFEGQSGSCERSLAEIDMMAEYHQIQINRWPVIGKLSRSLSSECLLLILSTAAAHSPSSTYCYRLNYI